MAVRCVADPAQRQAGKSSRVRSRIVSGSTICGTSTPLPHPRHATVSKPTTIQNVMRNLGPRAYCRTATRALTAGQRDLVHRLRLSLITGFARVAAEREVVSAAARARPGPEMLARARAECWSRRTTLHRRRTTPAPERGL